MNPQQPTVFLVPMTIQDVAYVSNLLNDAKAVPGKDVMTHASLMQRLSAPENRDSIVEQIRTQARNEAFQEMAMKAPEVPVAPEV